MRRHLRLCSKSPVLTSKSFKVIQTKEHKFEHEKSNNTRNQGQSIKDTLRDFWSLQKARARRTYQHLSTVLPVLGDSKVGQNTALQTTSLTFWLHSCVVVCAHTVLEASFMCVVVGGLVGGCIATASASIGRMRFFLLCFCGHERRSNSARKPMCRNSRAVIWTVHAWSMSVLCEWRCRQAQCCEFW